MYKMVVTITKGTWEKCGIRTVKNYNEKESITELWQKMSEFETQIKHSNVCAIFLKRIRNFCGKKRKGHYRRGKTKI